MDGFKYNGKMILFDEIETWHSNHTYTGGYRGYVLTLKNGDLLEVNDFDHPSLRANLKDIPISINFLKDLPIQKPYRELLARCEMVQAEMSDIVSEIQWLFDTNDLSKKS
jgi:hypothetical protein